MIPWNRAAFEAARERHTQRANQPTELLSQECGLLEKRNPSASELLLTWIVEARQPIEAFSPIALTVIAFWTALPLESVSAASLAASRRQFQRFPQPSRIAEEHVLAATGPTFLCNLEIDLALLEASGSLSPSGTQTIRDLVYIMTRALRGPRS
ncbi:hypothetical protein HY628_02070 [Candidatus Uhrbacteria bacterium]|nr:hypothetical protein [Candidatus Uhrbacteria bacterium]